MQYIADLHIHSKYSRATAKNLDLEHLYIGAQLKGITVVATGDYTHPAWFAEINNKLVPAEEGLFRLRDDIAAACDEEVPPACRREVRFILSTEISNIYKKNNVTRKNHNVVFMPGLEEAARFNAKLDAIGNIKSDGRPILGMDARDLLEIVLDVSEKAFLVPAHIWTPWFSLFGSKSGFDSIRECFDDLTPYIFALETGLSSDPPMNWRVSGIDGLTLISNSDAHSPANLGREANLFDTELSYAAMRDALRTGDPKRFLGTYEFFPEEGKYHYDGHRACGVSFHPAETLKHKGRCPVCGKPLTLGVLYRVEELADRPEGKKPERNHPFYSIVPLPEILSELLEAGVKSKRVTQAYCSVLNKLGTEFDVLYRLPLEEIRKSGITLLDVAVSRMRNGEITSMAGYDGEYGRISIFQEGEKEKLKGEQTLFAMPQKTASSATVTNNQSGRYSRQPDKDRRPKTTSLFEESALKTDTGNEVQDADITEGLNPQQLAAVNHERGPMVIMAGPGSGKTRTITCRISHLIRTNRVAASGILAITFTNKAAQEMAHRLQAMQGETRNLPLVATFHSFCLTLLKAVNGRAPVIVDDYDRLSLLGQIMQRFQDIGDPVPIKSARLLDMIASAKQHMLSCDDDLSNVATDISPETLSALYRAYQETLSANQACDYEDLIFQAVQLLERDGDVCESYRKRFPFIFIDEYQDVNYGQYRLVKALTSAASDICVIGDPDQAIYGFRGSSAEFFNSFKNDYPTAAVFTLDKNYRSTETILSASYNVISRQTGDSQRIRVYSGIAGAPAVTVARLNSDKAEAVFVGKAIEKMVGGLGFHSVDFGKAGRDDAAYSRAFSDIAVLFRTKSQGQVFADTFESAGIPCHLVGKESLFAARGVAETLSLLKLIEGCGSLVDVDRIVHLLYGQAMTKTVDILTAWSREHSLSAEAMLSRILYAAVPDITTAMRRKIADLAGNLFSLRDAVNGMQVYEKLIYLAETQRELHALISSGKKSREAFDATVETAKAVGANSAAFLERIALVSDADGSIPGIDRVLLMTMHAAKGLEFPVVFVAGCEEGYIP
ncbi:MAG TPA: UvrD-helicase domain-containing protein, partial [Geobacteraceae bacterium]|nr:UvrD-helicase domain-containing protein [Geobacteraceae bacterium]